MLARVYTNILVADTFSYKSPSHNKIYQDTQYIPYIQIAASMQTKPTVHTIHGIRTILTNHTENTVHTIHAIHTEPKKK